MTSEPRTQLGRLVAIHRSHWWSPAAVYGTVFVGTYSGLWLLMEPMAIPETIDFGNYYIERRVLHLLIAVLLASHVTLVVGMLARRTAIANSPVLTPQLSEEQLREIRDKLASEVSNLEDDRKALRADLLRGLDNPNRALGELRDLNDRLTRMAALVDELDSSLALQPGVAGRSRGLVDLEHVLISTLPIILLTALLAFQTPIAEGLSWIVLLLPEPVQLVFHYLAMLLGTLVYLYMGLIAASAVGLILITIYDRLRE